MHNKQTKHTKIEDDPQMIANTKHKQKKDPKTHTQKNQ
jgi:hypothetical protein